MNITSNQLTVNLTSLYITQPASKFLCIFGNVAITLQRVNLGGLAKSWKGQQHKNQWFN